MRIASPVMKGQAVRVRIHDEEAGLDICLAGTIRWQRRTPDNTWAVGCVFDKEIDYTLMGELFLNGILDTGPGASGE